MPSLAISFLASGFFRSFWSARSSFSKFSRDQISKWSVTPTRTISRFRPAY